MGKLIFSFLLLSLVSCHTRRNAINPFIEKGYCFEDTLSDLREQIKLNGYYEYSNTYTGSRNVKGETWGEFHSEKHKRTVFIKNYFYDNGLVMLNFRINDLSSGLLARYIIYDDTIKTIYTRTGGQTPGLEYKYFKIINDTTLEFLGFTTDKEIDSARIQEFKNGNPDELYNLGIFSKIRFVPSNYVPDYKTESVLKEKWFWCNEEKYDKFMQQLNNTK
jgi:hypothetical protein